jgi:poly-gamma-glutamate synthesis protein (capsule biosynthesis protein)
MKRLFLASAGFFLTVTLGMMVILAVNNNEVTSLFEPEFSNASELRRNENGEYRVYPAINLENSLRVQGQMQKQKGELVLRVTGDVAPVRVADIQLRKKGMEYAFSGDGISEILSEADLTLINLETPLVQNCPATNVGMIFCGLPDFAYEMKKVGIDLVGLANNHSGNYGQKGMEETKDVLKQAGLEYIDELKPMYAYMGEVKIGFLALNAIGKVLNREAVESVLAQMSESAEIIVVSVHWGKEYDLVPTSAPGIAPEEPIILGRWLVDQGVDLVVGHHPHVVQGVEIYKEGFIAYSHGNFIFDQEWSRETKQGVIGNYVFFEKELVDVYFTPVVIEDWVRPRVANTLEATEILDRMRKSSESILRREE